MPMYLQVILFAGLSIVANLKVLIQARAGKNRISTATDCILYNGLLFSFTAAISFFLLFDKSAPSLTTLIAAFGFGVISIIFQLTYLTAFTCGPVSLTAVIANFSVFFTSLFGVFAYNESFSVFKLLGLILIIVSFFLTVKSSNGDNKRVNLKWLILCCVTAVIGASGSIIQKIYQKSAAMPQSKLFVSYSYIFAAIVSFVVLLIFIGIKKSPSFKITKSTLLPTALAGAFLAIYQFGNSELAGIVDSMIMYPMLSGFTMISNMLLGIIFFKERLNPRQIIGILVGISAVVLIGF